MGSVWTGLNPVLTKEIYNGQQKPYKYMSVIMCY